MDSSRRRKSLDIKKLMASDHAVKLVNDGDSEFIVEFQGPKGSLYDGGIWEVKVELPIVYPDEPPIVEFKNKIFHPNIGEVTGDVCVDVLEEKWSPEYDLVNIFDVFLPELLRHPNPLDPLNSDAAKLMMQDAKLYEQKVKEYCELYAKDNLAPPVENESNDDKTSDDTSVADNSPRHVDP